MQAPPPAETAPADQSEGASRSRRQKAPRLRCAANRARPGRRCGAPTRSTRVAFHRTGEPVTRDDLINAAEGVFGRGAQGLAGLIENILRDQGEPIAYIAGQEAGGAFVFGVRYGSGTMHHQIEGERPVYWTGPSVGFDVGADANKVFVLVYNLHDSQDLFRRYPRRRGQCLFRRRLHRPISAPRRRRADPDPARRRRPARRQCRLYALHRAQPLAALLTPVAARLKPGSRGSTRPILDGLAALYHDDAVNHQVAERSGRRARGDPGDVRARIRALPKCVCIVEADPRCRRGRDPWNGAIRSACAAADSSRSATGRIAFQRGYWDKLSFLKQHGLPVE